MGKFKYSIVLASALVASPFAAANAADLGLPPEPIAVPAPVPSSACCAGGLYLKGFVGMTNQESDDLTSQYIENVGGFTVLDQGFDSTPLVGIGVGYAFSDRFRFDVTGEYRGSASFTGLDTYTVGGPGTNEYTAIKKDWLGLANLYWDIGTFHGLTPYVGAGIGWSNITIDNFKDVNVPAPGVSYANSNSENNFAWALHAGVAYEVSDNLKLDVGYRYVELGDASSGTITAYDNSGTFSQLELDNVRSHDILVGLRWQWDDTASACCQTASYAQPSYPTVYK